MTFYDDLLFPPELSYGSSGGPGFGNVIQETPGGGIRSVIQRLDEPRGRWDVSFDRTPERLGTILSFARITHGSLHGFRFIDFHDFSTAPDGITAVSSSDATHRHVLGTGDGTTQHFNCTKIYSSGARSATRRIRKPMRSTEAASATDYFATGAAPATMHYVWKAGTLQTLTTHYTIDYELGQIVFVTAPTAGQVIEWAGYFCVPVRMGREADELLSVTRQNKNQSTTQTIGIVEDPDSTQPLFSERDPGGSTTLTATAADSLLLISFGLGQMVRINPDAAAAAPLPCRLPVEADWMRGGPLFSIANVGAVDSLAVQTSTGSAIATLGPGTLGMVFLARDAAGTGWHWMVA